MSRSQPCKGCCVIRVAERLDEELESQENLAERHVER
jgi:hypothetical protein